MRAPSPARTPVYSGGRVGDIEERLIHPASGRFLLSSLPENGIEAGTKFRSDRTTRAPPPAARAGTAPRPFGTNCLAPPARAVACSSQRKGPRLRHRQTLPRSAIRSEQREGPRSRKRLVRDNPGASRHAPHLSPDTVRRGADRLWRGQPGSHGSISRHRADRWPPCRPLTARYAALPFARPRGSSAPLQCMAHSTVLSNSSEALSPNCVGGVGDHHATNTTY